MSYRLLIVEDSPELLEAMSDFFREEDAGLWEVVTASDGKDALARVTDEDFDLLILDIMLPGASGFDICKARSTGGTGLGLAIANNNLAMLGFKLDVKFEDDRFVATVKL